MYNFKQPEVKKKKFSVSKTQNEEKRNKKKRNEIRTKKEQNALCPCFFGRSACRVPSASSSFFLFFFLIMILASQLCNFCQALALDNRKDTKKEARKLCCSASSTLKRTLLLIVVGTEARGTSRDMDNVQMIGTKITAIKEYLYVRHSHLAARHSSFYFSLFLFIYLSLFLFTLWSFTTTWAVAVTL